MRIPPGEPRFVVSEIDGFTITGRERQWVASHAKPMLSVSVLDRAYNFEEVGRFNQEDVRPYNMTAEAKREALRNRAAGLAAILNAQHETDLAYRG